MSLIILYKVSYCKEFPIIFTGIIFRIILLVAIGIFTLTLRVNCVIVFYYELKFCDIEGRDSELQEELISE